MRALIQRVSRADVSVDGQTVGSIHKGILVLLGVGKQDTREQAVYLVEKIVNLRIFDDDTGRMNRSVTDVQGSILVVSQFTLYGDCRKGRRPDYTPAAPPELARTLYDEFIACLQNRSIPIQTGIFAASMNVSLINDGPVTFLLESPS